MVGGGGQGEVLQGQGGLKRRRPFFCTQHRLFQNHCFLPHCILFSEFRAFSRAGCWLGLGSKVAAEAGPSVPALALQCSPVYSRGSCQHPCTLALFLLPAWLSLSLLGPLGARHVGWGCPSPVTRSCLPSPHSLSLAGLPLCVTHLLFCLKLPTSFIIDSSLSSQVSPLHGPTNCPLL